MANAIYPKTKKRFMGGELDLVGGWVHAAPISVSGAGTVYAYSAAHASLADVPSGAVIATSPALTGKILGDDASFDSDDPDALSGCGCVNRGSDPLRGRRHQHLPSHVPGATAGLPASLLTPDGGDVQLLVDAAGWFRP